MIASTTVSATHIIASTSATVLEYKDYFSAEITIVAAVIGALAALVGTLAGSWISFKLQDEANKRKEIKNQIAAGHKAMFVLIRQWNELILIKRDVIDPIRKDPNINLLMRPLLPLDYKNLRYDFDSLGFLLETKYRNYITNLYIAEAKFHTTIQIINERSHLHREIVQPLWEKAGTPLPTSTQELEKILGIRITSRLVGLTQNSIEYIDETISFLEKTRDEITVALKELYPQGKIISFETLNNETNKTKEDKS